jgi:hypothetical protein
VIRAKKFGFVPQKHSQIISAQKANPTEPLFVLKEIRLRQASTFSPTYRRWEYPPFSSSLFTYLYQLSIFYKQAGSTANPLALVKGRRVSAHGFWLRRMRHKQIDVRVVMSLKL